MKAFELEDPMALMGVRLDEDPDDAAFVDMAWAIVEEYVRLGWSGEQILRLFRSPIFRMSHRVLEVKGEAFVRELVSAADAIRGQAALQEGGA